MQVRAPVGARNGIAKVQPRRFAVAAVLVTAVASLWILTSPPEEQVLYNANWRAAPADRCLMGLSQCSTPPPNCGSDWCVESGASISIGCEATFGVRRDAAHPFVVHAGPVTAEALGTHFQRAQVGRDGIEVSVLEGHVEMRGNSSRYRTGDQRPLEGSGRRHSIWPALESENVQAADLARIDGWHVHRFVFKSAPLRSALEEYNRYSTIPLGCRGPLARQRSNQRGCSNWRFILVLRALQETFGIQYRVVGARVELLRTTG